MFTMYLIAWFIKYRDIVRPCSAPYLLVIPFKSFYFIHVYTLHIQVQRLTSVFLSTVITVQVWV